ncbi:39S ribosomal protein L20, mitochondrial-like [Microtus oregoni]|uniref:39S ribosomal protein L20, mitochondrial-like n=1 Tax=Microtus oregoni TaxID=111838 RepID=UPI001BB1E030|nr:39S ribosomal protein L20, mitochondrial-like [Microtus oregoni]
MTLFLDRVLTVHDNFYNLRLWLQNRLTDWFWQVQEVLKHAWHFRGRKNRRYRLVVRAVTRAVVKGTQARRLKKQNLSTLWINRISAASQEHGLQYPAFMVNLIKCQVELNRKVLVDLAIYEPKTFTSLAALAKRRQQEGFAAALGDGKEPEGIFFRVVQYH